MKPCSSYFTDFISIKTSKSKISTYAVQEIVNGLLKEGFKTNHTKSLFMKCDDVSNLYYATKTFIL